MVSSLALPKRTEERRDVERFTSLDGLGGAGPGFIAANLVAMAVGEFKSCWCWSSLAEPLGRIVIVDQ